MDSRSFSANACTSRGPAVSIGANCRATALPCSTTAALFGERSRSLQISSFHLYTCCVGPRRKDVTVNAIEVAVHVVTIVNLLVTTTAAVVGLRRRRAPGDPERSEE